MDSAANDEQYSPKTPVSTSERQRLVQVSEAQPLHSHTFVPKTDENDKKQLKASSGGKAPTLAPIEIPPPHSSESRGSNQNILISVPDSMAGVGTPKSEFSNLSLSQTLDVCVYLMDKKGIQMTVEDGRRTTAGELFEMVMEEIEMPTEARHVFSLWMVSDLLELQLKPHHVPFKLTCQWDELLQKYTMADEDDIERDEPIVMFQRNVFFPTAEEERITDPKILKYLFYEAKENIIDGRYVVSQEEYDMLAGLLAVVNEGPFVAITHTPEFFRPNLDQYYPEHMCKTKWSILGRSKSSPEFRLVESYQSASERYYKSVEEDSDNLFLVYQKYLEFCRSLPFYGAAYFNGQIEHPSRFLSHYDDPVYVAINTEGVYLIDIDKVQLLFGKLFRHMSWDYAEPREKSNKNALPCLWMQYEAEENSKKVTKLLQVFSKEAIMMDALIDACVAEKKRQMDAGIDVVDGSDTERQRKIQERLKKGEAYMSKKRLCVTTFNDRGICIDDRVKKVSHTVPRNNRHRGHSEA